MRKIGTWTAGAVLLGTGAALLAEMLGAAGIDWLLKVWPAALILLGIEYILTPTRDGEPKPRIAFGRLIGVGLLCAVAVVALQGWSIASKGGSDWESGLFDWIGGESIVINREPVTSPLAASSDKLKLVNANGSATFTVADRNDVEVQATVRTGLGGNQADARHKAENAQVEITERDGTLYIETKVDSYRFWFMRLRPRVDLVITLPSSREIDVEVAQQNGNVRASGIPLKTSFNASTTNGRIEVSEMTGEMTLHTTNGSVTATAVEGLLDAASTNGSIEIFGGAGEVRASTTNGKLIVDSTSITGDWELSTTNGNVELRLPQQADFQLSGRTTNGSITAGPAFEVNGKRITGQIGSGRFQVEAKTTNGKFSVELQ